MSNCICLFLSFAASCSLASRNESFTRKNPFWGLVSPLIDISGIGILLSPPPQTIKQVVEAYNSLSFRHLIGKVLINPILEGYVFLCKIVVKFNIINKAKWTVPNNSRFQTSFQMGTYLRYFTMGFNLSRY